jgi:hypothetical protein
VIFGNKTEIVNYYTSYPIKTNWVLNMAVLWDDAPCGTVDADRRFRGAASIYKDVSKALSPSTKQLP